MMFSIQRFLKHDLAVKSSCMTLIFLFQKYKDEFKHTETNKLEFGCEDQPTIMAHFGISRKSES